MGNCAKWEKAALWTAGEDPVDNSPPKPDGFPPHAPPFQENLAFLCELVGAIESAVAEIGARMDAFEFAIHRLFAFIDEPVPADELVARLKQLREDIRP